MLRRGLLDYARIPTALDAIEQNARHQVRLIEDLLDVSRIVTGNLVLQRERIDVAAVLHAGLEAAGAAADAKGIAVQIELAAVGPVLGDPARLQQVFANLLSNAIKFTPDGGKISVDLGPAQGRTAEVTMADTGVGIRADILPYVFDRFRQADSSTTRRYGGLGLGLAIARHLVELHGGTIAAESAGEGRGATFRVRLPLASDGRYVVPIEASLTLDPQVLSGLRIVVVDDQPDARDFLTVVLGRYGADVTPATSAATALEAIQGMRPDVLVADIAMPDEDGHALVRRVRRLEAGTGHTTRAIALTALASLADRDRSLAAGFDVYLSKPIDPVELVSAVAQTVAR
jgi:CheY-like chemotaxis protein